jgi:phenylpyruvate tautomerase PptA (4-oxalocrotonate tautomerase family)
MPTYVCSTAAGRLDASQRAQIAEAITAIHGEEARAPGYLVQVIFHDIAPGSHFIGGRPAPDDQIWVRADIRSGRTDAQKQALLERCAADISRIAHASRDQVWVYICDLLPTAMLEFGRVLPPPGQEAEWFASLPAELQQRLRSLG